MRRSAGVQNVSCPQRIASCALQLGGSTTHVRYKPSAHRLLPECCHACHIYLIVPLVA